MMNAVMEQLKNSNELLQKVKSGYVERIDSLDIGFWSFDSSKIDMHF